MIKVMIADDEQIVVDGLKFMLSQLYSDVEVVAEANSGRAIIEASMMQMPDIVLMDIKMPGINGIEAIETIKKRHQDTKFIIISAYEQFDYAKQAVELGVSHYILKPVVENKLKDVMDKVLMEIKEERKSIRQEMENREKLERIIPVLEHGFIYALLMNADYRSELHKYQELFEIKRDNAYVMILEFGDNGEAETLENKIGSGLKGQSLYPKVNSAIKYKCKAIVGPMIINRITVVIYEEKSLSEYDQRLRALSVAENIKKAIEQIMETNVHAGIGSCYPSDKIRHSLEEASFALNRITDEEVLHFNDSNLTELEESDYTYLDIKEDEARILSFVESGHMEQLEKELKSFFNKVEKAFGHSIQDIKHVVTELMVLVLSTAFRHQLKENKLGYGTYINEIRNIEQIIPLEQWCIKRIKTIADAIKNHRHENVSAVVMDAKLYMDKHFNEDLSLNDVSKMVAVSPQYFSKIFKEEIGLSFVEYLRKKRMDIAKEMLAQKQYSIKEICYHIGYNDPNYFSRLFKKMVGVTPTDYQ